MSKNIKPSLSTVSIWNMSLGFLGVQMGFALQNGNASRILQSFGADVHELGYFWLVAPLTGMIVQPIIGHMSDKTWGRFGRRKPYFLIGAIMASLGLVFMPNAEMFTAFLPALWIGAGMLMIMDASFNIAMEPFRALVADNLPDHQKTQGFSVQTILIGIGAVIGSWLPSILAYLGVSTSVEDDAIPDNLKWSFVIGAIILMAAILGTVFTTKEYSPEELAAFDDATEFSEHEKGKSSFFGNIITDLMSMPTTMTQLGLVQFFSWFALFGMWVYTTPAIAQNVFDLAKDDAKSANFNIAGDWVGILFGIYNLVSAIFAFFLPSIANKIGRKRTHALALTIGGVGLVSMYFITNQYALIFSMICIGVAWASILAMPYAILGNAIPAKKMGVYMGLFNLFITIPQITNATLGSFIVKSVFDNTAIYAILLAGVMMLIAAFCMRFVEDKGNDI